MGFRKGGKSTAIKGMGVLSLESVQMGWALGVASVLQPLRCGKQESCPFAAVHSSSRSRRWPEVSVAPDTPEANLNCLPLLTPSTDLKCPLLLLAPGDDLNCPLLLLAPDDDLKCPLLLTILKLTPVAHSSSFTPGFNLLGVGRRGVRHADHDRRLLRHVHAPHAAAEECGGAQHRR